MDIDCESLLAELVDAVHFLDGFIHRDKCKQVAETIRVHLGWPKLKPSGKEFVRNVENCYPLAAALPPPRN